MLKKIFSLILSFITTILFLGVNAMAGEKECNEKIVASYIPLYENWKAEDIDGKYLTDAIIAFAKFDSNNRVYFDSNDQTTIDEARRLKELYPHLNVSLSIGGWGVTEFSDVVKSTELRKFFVSDCIEILETYNMNGIDIDWEYPVGEGWLPDIDKQWEDKKNFTTLLEEFRTELDKLEKKSGKKYILSYATNISEWAITNLEYKRVFDIVDRINIMGYAYEGSWSNKTGHASNLYPYRNNGFGLSSSEAVDLFIKYGAPKEKLVLGVPAFSQDWYGVKNENNGLNQPFKGSDNLNMGYTKLKNEYVNKNGFTRYWDNMAKMPYLYNGDMFISYEDEESIKAKCDYILDKRIGGIMTWQYLQDKDANLLKVMSKTLNPSDDETSEVESWAENREYKKGDMVLYNGIKYECILGHTSLISWEPDRANTLWSITLK